MEGLSRAVASPLPVRWSGRMRLLDPLRLKDVGAIEFWLLDRVRRPTEAVLESLDGLPLDMAAGLMEEARGLEEALPNHTTPEDFDSALSAPEGLSVALWLCFRRNHPEMSLEDVETEVRGMSEAEQLTWRRRVYMTSGIDRFASRDWLILPGDELEEEDEPRKRMNWKHAARKLIEGYWGTTLEAIGNLTLFQFRLLCLPEGDVKGRRMPLGEFRRRAKRGDWKNMGWERRKKKGA